MHCMDIITININVLKMRTIMNREKAYALYAKCIGYLVCSVAVVDTSYENVWLLISSMRTICTKCAPK